MNRYLDLSWRRQAQMVYVTSPQPSRAISYSSHHEVGLDPAGAVLVCHFPQIHQRSNLTVSLRLHVALWPHGRVQSTASSSCSPASLHRTSSCSWLSIRRRRLAMIFNVWILFGLTTLVFSFFPTLHRVLIKNETV